MTPKSAEAALQEAADRQTFLGLFRDGSVTMQCKPSHVCLAHPDFTRRLTVPIFRSLFNLVKRIHIEQVESMSFTVCIFIFESGSNTEFNHFLACGENAENDGTTPVKSTDMGTKRPFLDAASADIEGPEAEILQEKTWSRPQHMVTRWTCPDDKVDKMALIVNMPSGIGADDFDFKVEDSGEAVELELRKPGYLQSETEFFSA